MGLGVLQKPSRSLFLNCVSAVINITAKVASLMFIDNGSMDNGLLHGFWWQHRPWTWPLKQPEPRTSTWLQAAAKTRDICWLSAATWAMGINTEPGYSKTLESDMTLGSSTDMNITVASGGSTGHPHQPGPHCCRVSSSTSLHRAHTLYISVLPISPSHIVHLPLPLLLVHF